MSQFSPSRTSRPRTAFQPAYPPVRRPVRQPVRQPATWAAFAFPAIGGAVAGSSALAAYVVADLAGTLALGDSAGPGQPAYDYVTAYFPGSAFGFLTGYPLAFVACVILVLAATGLAVRRKWILAVLLLVVTAAIPWIPGLAFIGHLWSLPLH